jgi:hypothetical protein
MMKKIILSTVAVAAMSTMTFAGGEVTPADQTIDAFNAKNLFDKVHFKGDLRLRYESKETDYETGTDSSTYHNRYRLRLMTDYDLADNLQFNVGMRSGFANPTSGNQTFETDQALSDYFLESMRFNILGATYVSGNSTLKVGRQPYLMYRPIKSQLVWDNDISLDGVNYNYTDDTKMITVGINQTSMAEASIAQNDVNLFLAQYVRTVKLEDSKLNLGTGIYYYNGIKGNTSLYHSNSSNPGMGNTMVNGSFVNDYHIVEGFAEWKLKDLFGKPFAMAAGVAYNTAASDKNFGYDFGVQLGKAENVGDWEIKYSYTDIQADAVLGAHCDSDNFDGGTAAKGHAIRMDYKFDTNTYLAANFFFNTFDAGKKVGKPEADYERVQLDAIIKF